MSECLFCRIITGEIPSRQVYADEVAYAFLDVEPWQEGHTLVVPRRHVDHALVMLKAQYGIAPAGSQTVNQWVSANAATGFNVLTNVGPDSGQAVFHAHVHVLPRHADAPGISNMRGPIRRGLDEIHRVLVENGTS